MNSDALAITIAAVLSAVVFVPLLVGGVLVVRDTLRGRGRWGVNLKPVRCPECGETPPAVRRPKNRRQALWGGHTCDNCSTEFDKWGHRVP